MLKINANQIDDIIDIMFDIQCIDNIITTSSHKRKVLDVMNNLLSSHEEWKDTLFMLADYSKQKWAITAIDKYSLNDDDISIIKSNILSNSIGVMKYSSDLIEIIENGIYRLSNQYKQIIESVHKLNAPDVSKYIMNKMYEPALCEFCKANNEIISKYINKYKNNFAKMDSDRALLYHDTDAFIKSYRSINKTKNIKLYSIDENKVRELLELCFLIIKNEYINDGEIYSRILKRYVFDGMSDKKIALEFGVSETKIITKRKYATELLSLLLWGYTSNKYLT